MAAITDPKGAAVQVGIRDDDEIVSVNGTPTNNMSLAQIRRSWSEPNANQVTISFQREGLVKSVVLELSQEREPFPITPSPATVKSIDDKK